MTKKKPVPKPRAFTKAKLKQVRTGKNPLLPKKKSK